jgi:hypothetical protein
MELTRNEKRLLQILGRRKRLISDLAAEFYKTRKIVPVAPGNSVLYMVKQIKRKKGARYLKIAGTLGRNGKTVWRNR